METNKNPYWVEDDERIERVSNIVCIGGGLVVGAFFIALFVVSFFV